MSKNDNLRTELNEMEWGALRKRCREAGIGVLPEHTKENLIAMYMEKAATHNIFAGAVSGSQIKPGYVRIKLSAGEAAFAGVSAKGDNRVTGQPESAVEFMHNSRFYCIPRNKEVDIPAYALSCITDAKVVSVFEDADTGNPVMKLGPAYNYQVIGHGPPADLRDPGARTYEGRDLKHRMEYFRKHKRFPTERDLALDVGRQVPATVYA